MRQPAALRPDDTRFFDGGDDSQPPDTAAPPVYEFVRVNSGDHERFRLRRRIGYRARGGGGAGSTGSEAARIFIVPRDLSTWTTDFASVPWFFAWLVPRSGSHLPAALLHDALVEGPRSYIGPVVTRDEADRIFREAMADLGTGVVRRWLVWTAVSLATILLGRVGPPGSQVRWYYAAAGWSTLGAIAWLGTLATLDVAGVGEDWPVVFELPWMRGRTFWIDIVQGAAGALVIPVLAGLAWGRFWRAGMIAGVALAFLLHVTVVILVLTGVYWGLEALGSIRHGRLLLLLIGVVVLAALLLFVRALG